MSILGRVSGAEAYDSLERIATALEGIEKCFKVYLRRVHNIRLVDVAHVEDSQVDWGSSYIGQPDDELSIAVREYRKEHGLDAPETAD